MYAMLTGTLPFTVEPFSLRALHQKMVDKEMNPLPPSLSTGEHKMCLRKQFPLYFTSYPSLLGNIINLERHCVSTHCSLLFAFGFTALPAVYRGLSDSGYLCLCLFCVPFSNISYISSYEDMHTQKYMCHLICLM